MAVMPNIEAEAAKAAGWFENRLHHASAAQPAATATQGESVSNLLADAKAILHEGLAKLETLDEGVVNVTDPISANPTAVTIANTLAGIAHLPDPMGLLGVVDSTLKSFAGVLAK